MRKKCYKISWGFCRSRSLWGGSARIIVGIKGNKSLHLFDTFEGLPKPSNMDDTFKGGEFVISLESIRKKFKKFKNVYFHKGIFPSTAKKVKNKKFSFVHLDVDLYQSTKDGLEFFYPRMVKGGIILSHDYPFKGINRAFDEFFLDKPECVIQLADSQAMVVKS